MKRHQNISDQIHLLSFRGYEGLVFGLFFDKIFYIVNIGLDLPTYLYVFAHHSFLHLCLSISYYHYLKLIIENHH